MSIMKNDGTELTAEDIRRVWLDHNLSKGNVFESILTYLNSVLPRREGLSVEEVEAMLMRTDSEDNDALSLSYRELAKFIQPLTVQQGFVPNWEEAPEWADGACVVWSSEFSSLGEFHFIPRPKVKRMRTVAELTQEWVDEQYHSKEMDEDRAWKKLAIELANGKSIQELCRAAKIDLETEE